VAEHFAIPFRRFWGNPLLPSRLRRTSSRSLEREFEEGIAVEVTIEAMSGSD